MVEVKEIKARLSKNKTQLAKLIRIRDLIKSIGKDEKLLKELKEARREIEEKLKGLRSGSDDN